MKKITLMALTAFSLLGYQAFAQEQSDPDPSDSTAAVEEGIENSDETKKEELT